jgi:transposase
MNGEGISIRSIAAAMGNSRQKVTEIIRKAEDKGLVVPLPEEMTDKWLEEFLFPEQQLEAKGRHLPDFNLVHKELAKPNVTLTLLHEEYEVECRTSGKIPYAYRSFCDYYTSFAKKYKATMRIRRKPGEIMEVDWAGSTSYIVDRDTGEKIKAYVFVAVLPCSQISYAEAFLTMKSVAWITAHNHAFEYFGGSTDIIVPDNLKTGVKKNDGVDIILNESYRELGEHYGSIILPARVSTPKDKASVEGSVGVISTWIIAALRNTQCFTIEDLNHEIRKKLKEFNERPFTKKPGSRISAFEEEEKFALNPLPLAPYKMSVWKKAKVQLNYHVSVESMFYSVPYEYIQQNIDIRMTENLIELYFNSMRIATHKRLYGQFGQYATVTDHMPDNHRMYVEHTPESSVEWAETVGSSTVKVVQHLLDRYQNEKQALKSIMSLKSLGKKYSKEEIETACSSALSYASSPSVKGIQTILKSNKQKQTASSSTEATNTNTHGFTRGASYYGGK